MRSATGTGSFQGGASGPSQDQVYEAIEIFGESIQDFDFMKPADEEDEVSRSVEFVGSSVRRYSVCCLVGLAV